MPTDLNHGSKETYKIPDEKPLDQLESITTQPFYNKQSHTLRPRCCTLSSHRFLLHLRSPCLRPSLAHTLSLSSKSLLARPSFLVLNSLQRPMANTHTLVLLFPPTSRPLLLLCSRVLLPPTLSRFVVIDCVLMILRESLVADNSSV